MIVRWKAVVVYTIIAVAMYAFGMISWMFWGKGCYHVAFVHIGSGYSAFLGLLTVLAIGCDETYDGWEW